MKSKKLKKPMKNPFKEDGRLKQERRRARLGEALRRSQAMQRFNRPKMMPFTRRGI